MVGAENQRTENYAGGKEIVRKERIEPKSRDKQETPRDLTQENVEDLEAALEQFREIVVDLGAAVSKEKIKANER